MARKKMWALWMYVPGWFQFEAIPARTKKEATLIIRAKYGQWMNDTYKGRWKVAPAVRP